MAQRLAEFRFYEELNDFLPPARRKLAFSYAFAGTPSVKDAIEAIGVPHTEIDLILVDGESVGFDRLLRGGERVAVYPMFERFDIAPLVRLRARPLRRPRFVLDVHLGKLARYLRLVGFDALYRNDYDDPTIIRLALAEGRVILTRDKGILKHAAVTHGYWLREVRPPCQLREVVRVFQLNRQLQPFSRCLDCNGELQAAARDAVLHGLPPHTRQRFETFYQCRECRKVYWAGSHYERMRAMVEELQTPPEAKLP
ncbi:MAG: Mut7-C ubiquitin/RNAse domain-containing protein [Pseudomonadota bacterium]|nr:Mut7-C ubiquitin/RNAse domain-containing protein [Pseudomonadota bacterium]